MSLQTVGRYEILGELGRGAMGVVYRAKDPTIGRTVALKTMRIDAHGADGGDLVRRFQNEARAAGVLNHPNIVTIYDAGEQDGMFYIAMEFIEGTTLQELLAEKHLLAPDEAIQITRDICKGLDYAHRNGIVHRDVKPANIMITRQGTVKIMDFGIAKAGGSMTSTGQVLGTPNYMSPEQVRGRTLDGRSDLFSLGVVLYEMLTGEKPFVGQNVTTIIYKIVNEKPIAPRELDITVHSGLSNIILKALAKSPDERYQSCAELVRDLEHYKATGGTPHATARSTPPAAPLASDKTVVMPMRVVSGTAVRAAAAPAARPEPVPLRPPEPERHSNRETILFAVILILLLAGVALGGYAYYRTRVQPQKLEAEIKADEMQMTKPLPAESATGAAAPSGTPDSTATPADSQIASDKTAKGAESKSSEASPFTARKPSPERALVVPPTEISFSSRPDGAVVQIDGASDPTWQTPFTNRRIAPGAHSVVFSKDGYVPETRNVELTAGKSMSLAVVLTPGARLIVTSNPPGGEIWVDGQDAGVVAPAQLTLAKGLHQVLVKKTGYRDGFWEGNLSAGQTTTFNPVLLSLNQSAEKGPSPSFLSRFLGTDAIPEGKGLVHIRTVPDGATIIINGRIAPRKTNARWPADPGVYSIDLQLEGYKSVHRNIQVKQGKILPIDEILEKQ